MAIESFTQQHWFLSNFSSAPIEWRGKEWRSVEHAYQAAKAYDPRTREPVDEEAVENVRNAETPGDAKKLGRKIAMVPEWEHPYPGPDDEPLKIQVMRELVHLKFQIPERRQQLLSTGLQELVEGNWWDDTFWGVCGGEGTNWLGKVLMDERAAIRTQEGSQ